MTVVDASALVELLLNREPAGRLAARLLTGEPMYAPQLLLLEVQSVLRRLALTGEVTPERSQLFLRHFSDLPLVYYPHEPLMTRIWELRHNVTTYDAAYIALAEALPGALVTSDTKLAGSSGHHAQIEVL